MIPLPDSMRIGPYTVPVWRDIMDDCGEYDPPTLTIRIKNGMPESLERETFVHELLHAVWDCAGLPTKNEEKIIDRLATSLTDAFLDNPQLKDVLFPPTD